MRDEKEKKEEKVGSREDHLTQATGTEWLTRIMASGRNEGEERRGEERRGEERRNKEWTD